MWVALLLSLIRDPRQQPPYFDAFTQARTVAAARPPIGSFGISAIRLFRSCRDIT